MLRAPTITDNPILNRGVEEVHCDCRPFYSVSPGLFFGLYYIRQVFPFATNHYRHSNIKLILLEGKSEQ